MKTAKNLFLAALLTVAASFAATNDDLVRLIMPDAKVVSGINISTARNSPFGQLVIAQIQKDEKGMKELYDNTGFDPKRDMDQVLLASGNLQAKNNGLVLVSGRFDVGRITAAVQAKSGAAVTKYRGFDTIQSGKATDTGVMAFLSNSIAVIGDRASVQAALDRAATGPNVDAAMQRRIQELSGTFDAWFLSDSPASSFTGMLPIPKLGGENNATANVVQSIQQTSGGVRFGNNVEIHGEAVTRSAKDATALMNVVQFVASMVQMNRDKPGAGEAASVLDSMVVRTKGATMTLDLAMPQTDVEKMFKENESHKKAPRKTAHL